MLPEQEIMDAAARESGLWQEYEDAPVLREIYMRRLLRPRWAGERSYTEKRYCSLVWRAKQPQYPYLALAHEDADASTVENGVEPVRLENRPLSGVLEGFMSKQASVSVAEYRKLAKRLKRTEFEDRLSGQLKLRAVAEFVREYRFHAPRRWRFDFAWPEIMLAVEVEGAVWANGRHTRGSGFVKDMEKYNCASADGWTVLRFPTAQVLSQHAADEIERVLREKRG